MTEHASRSRFSTLGLDVGVVGRWSRLVWGLLILIPIVTAVTRPGAALEIVPGAPIRLGSGGFYLQGAVYLVGITAAYVLVYWALGERFFATANPWINTAILVGPAFTVAWWPIIFAPTTGIEIPEALALAMGVYVGISFILQWPIRYGGCEVVSIPIILLRRRYVTYCVPLVALDAVEKKLIDSRASKHAAPTRQAALASSSRHG